MKEKPTQNSSILDSATAQQDVQGIIGMGSSSARKSYYPELQKKMEELRQEKNKFERIFSEALGGIFQAHTDGSIIDANPAMGAMCGYSDLSKFKAIDNVFHQLFAIPIDIERLMELLHTDGSVIGFETKFRSHQDTLVDVSLNASLRSDQSDLYLECFVENITERKATEEKQLTLKKLESLGVLAGGIAHDFNNLLTGLLGNIEMTKMLLPDGHRAQQMLDAARTAVNNATGLTNQLMTFAKGGDPIKKTIDLALVIEESATFIAQGVAINLHFDFAPDLWLVKADRGQIGQVVTNLIINAQQAMTKNGTIIIKTENLQSEAGPFVQFSVIDEGSGISPDKLDKIFDPYYTTKDHGNGLGLASVYSIINKHKGSVVVESELNKGTVFTVKLPALGEALVGSSENQNRKADSVAGSKSILLLDDEELVLNMTTAMLEEMGFSVVKTLQSEETLACYTEALNQNSCFDLVILDLTIPGGVGGQHVAQDILKLNPAAKIIAASGYSNDPVMVNLHDFGFCGGIAKPFHFKDLKNVIYAALDQLEN